MFKVTEKEAVTVEKKKERDLLVCTGRKREILR